LWQVVQALNETNQLTLCGCCCCYDKPITSAHIGVGKMLSRDEKIHQVLKAPKDICEPSHRQSNAGILLPILDKREVKM